MTTLKSAALCLAFTLGASAGMVFLPAYPAGVVVFDESKGTVVEKIPLSTGIPMSIRLSQDHKRIYVTTVDHNGIDYLIARRHDADAPGLSTIGGSPEAFSGASKNY